MQEVYEMVDSVPLSRAKRNINRDFADGVMMAELIHHYSPKLVSLHNYPAANSLAKKVQNWNTLSLKVLKRLGISLSRPQIDEIVAAVPNAIEQLLYQVLIRFERPDEEGRLTQNARRMEGQTRPHGRPAEQTLELEEGATGERVAAGEGRAARRLEFETEVVEGYENLRRATQEEEEVAELMERIEQAYSQLAKLTQLNKVKEDVVRNLEKKLEKYIFT